MSQCSFLSQPTVYFVTSRANEFKDQRQSTLLNRAAYRAFHTLCAGVALFILSPPTFAIVFACCSVARACAELHTDLCGYAFDFNNSAARSHSATNDGNAGNARKAGKAPKVNRPSTEILQ